MSGQQRSEVERKRARVNVCRETRDAVRERARRREVVRAGGAAGSESKGKKKKSASVSRSLGSGYGLHREGEEGEPSYRRRDWPCTPQVCASLTGQTADPQFCAMTPVDGSHDLVAVEELLLQIPLLLLPVPVLVPRTVPLYHNTLGSGTGKRERKTHRSSAGRDCFRLE